MLRSDTPPRGGAWRGQLTEPGRLWIRWRPRVWPWPAQLCTDLSSARLGLPRRRDRRMPEPPDRPMDDLIYLPPVESGREEERRQLAADLEAGGAPVLVQHGAGDQAGGTPGLAVFDLLPALTERRLELLERLPRRAVTVWPLIAGVTDGAELSERGLERLEAAGVACVVPLALELEPAERRRLASRLDDDAYHTLFHAPMPSEREFSRQAAARGLCSTLARPLPVGPPSRVVNRKIAGSLTLAADLWLRVGRQESRGQHLFRVARWADDTHLDLGALAREGNLSVVDWLEEESRQLIVDVATEGTSGLILELLQEYQGWPHAPFQAGGG